MKIRFIAFLGIAVAAVLCPQSVSAALLQLNRAKLAEIPKQMQAFVTNGTISGAVTLVAQYDGIVSLENVGLADIEQKKVMRSNTLFWIASMTKPITAAAVLMLQDSGRLDINDPVEKHLPEFKDPWMVQEKTPASVVLVRPPRPITIKDLLTHTSGIGDVPAPRPHSTLAELVMGYSQLPLKFAPGSKWEYSNAGINTLGRIVEVVSGEDFASFLTHHIFIPLRMNDTTFWPTTEQAQRVATAYQPAQNGQGLEPTPIGFIKGGLSDRRRTPFPAGGLFSTAQDIYRFYQMMLNGGIFEGKRLLSQGAVAQLTRTQTGDLKTGFTDGMSFGLGFAVVKEPTGVTAMLSRGSFGHGGAYGTQSWVDPEKKMIFILMIQRAKLPNADASDVRRVFQEIAVGALIRN